jgi:hypothetical protein
VKGAAFARPRVQGHAAVVQRHQPAGDRQAQADAAALRLVAVLGEL